ncbi:MAG: mannose-1-phosphate guanylyltransferase [Chloroflexi bacterium]|nr:mannose-1-phosphate guanylyltransferase [Chloroflexota bacterium]
MDARGNNVHVTILAGGSGTRLWPLSRQARPKQLLRLTGERSLLQQTMDRVLPLVPIEHVYILSGPNHVQAIAQQLPDLPPENLFVEPSPRGTGPSLGLAALRLRRRHGGKAIMVSLHADHVIADEEAFRRALRAAIATARKGFLVTVGIVPTSPETGFGYIQRGAPLESVEGQPVYRVRRFTEKPPLPLAQQYVQSGEYYWNAGYFAWTLDNILEEFQRLLPETFARLDAIVPGIDDEHTARIWDQIVPITIDVGIIEGARKVAVVPGDMGWNDVGSWAALHDIMAQDAQRCVVMGSGARLLSDTENTLIYHDNEDKLVAVVGAQDMIIVNTEDALLIIPKSRAQEVSQLVRELRRRGLERYL